MVHRIRRIIGRYAGLVVKHELIVLLVTLATLVISVWGASQLKLKSDLKELLPPNYESVKELDRVIDKVGGVGSLIIAVQSPDVDANKRFMDDLAARLSQLPPGTIRSLNYKGDEIRKFYEDHFLYYIDKDDLDLFYSRLKHRIDYEKFKRTPFFLELGEEAPEPEALEFEDIRARNEKKFSAPIATVDDYYGGEWGEMLVMVVRPFGSTVTIDSARQFIATIDGAVKETNPSSYEPRMRVDYCGDVKSTIDEYETLKHDIVSTSLLCIALVSLAIIVFFLRIRVVFLLGATLIVAIAWTFALTRLVIGYLNAQTAFLGSIIVGTGINYGIILMARYLEERKKHRAPAEAMRHAMETTAAPVFLAAATTAISFAVLFVARIRGLSQFGFIGAAGVMLCWAATMFVLPAMTTLSERILKLVKPRTTPERKSALFDIATRIAARSPAVILGMSVMAAVASVVIIARFAPNAMEYDFTKMRNQVSVESGTEALEKRVSRLFKSSMTPSIVLVDSLEEGREVCAAVDAQNQAIPPAERRVGSCHSITDLLPTDQEEKLPVMAKINDLVSQAWVRELKGDVRSKVDRLKRS
ncbi:MAG: MMPL family transporter, partial [bacterium]